MDAPTGISPVGSGNLSGARCLRGRNDDKGQRSPGKHQRCGKRQRSPGKQQRGPKDKGERSPKEIVEERFVYKVYAWVTLANSDTTPNMIPIYVRKRTDMEEFLGEFNKFYAPDLNDIPESKMLVKRHDGTVIKSFESSASLGDDHCCKKPLSVELLRYHIVPTARGWEKRPKTPDPFQLYAWVTLANSNIPPRNMVVTDCTDISYFKRAIKKLFAPDLDRISISMMLVKRHDGTVIKSFKSPASLGDDNSYNNPLLVELTQHRSLPIAAGDYFPRGNHTEKPDVCRLYVWVKLFNSNAQVEIIDATDCTHMGEFKNEFRKMHAPDLDAIPLFTMVVTWQDGTKIEYCESLASMIDEISYENPILVRLRDHRVVPIAIGLHSANSNNQQYTPGLNGISSFNSILRRPDGTVVEFNDSTDSLTNQNCFECPLSLELPEYEIISTKKMSRNWVWVHLANSNTLPHKINVIDCINLVEFKATIKKTYTLYLDAISSTKLIIRRLNRVVRHNDSIDSFTDQNCYEYALSIELLEYKAIHHTSKYWEMFDNSIWVQIAKSAIHPRKINFIDRIDVSDFKSVIKKEYTPYLDEVPVPMLSLTRPDGTMIKSNELLTSLMNQSSCGNPFFIIIIPSATCN